MKIGKWIFAAIAFAAAVALVGCPSPTRPGRGDPGGDSGDNGDTTVTPPGGIVLSLVGATPAGVVVGEMRVIQAAFGEGLTPVANLNWVLDGVFAAATGGTAISPAPAGVDIGAPFSEANNRRATLDAGAATVGQFIRIRATYGPAGPDQVVSNILAVPVLAADAPALTGITISGDTTVVAGGTIPLTATAAPPGASLAGIAWTSSDTAVATVNAAGEVTGVVAGGPVTITAAVGTTTATHSVTVTTPVMRSLGSFFNLTANIPVTWRAFAIIEGPFTPAAGLAASGPALTWVAISGDLVLQQASRTANDNGIDISMADFAAGDVITITGRVYASDAGGAGFRRVELTDAGFTDLGAPAQEVIAGAATGWQTFAVTYTLTAGSPATLRLATNHDTSTTLAAGLDILQIFEIEVVR